MGVITERYRMTPMGANATLSTDAIQLGGFLAKTAGTITVVDKKGVTAIDAFPVAIGVYYPIPGLLGVNGIKAVITLAGGASGTLFSA